MSRALLRVNSAVHISRFLDTAIYQVDIVSPLWALVHKCYAAAQMLTLIAC